MSGRDLHSGSCLCGGVAFTVRGPLPPVVACHCTQCRRTSGHVWAATTVPDERFELITASTLCWYRSSEAVERGFCGHCGASLFWRPLGSGTIYVAGGALDGAMDLHVGEHWFTGDAGDYYCPEGPPPAQVIAPPSGLDCSCLCGAVRFGLPGPAGAITACHCTQCRKLSGHYSASFDAEEETVRWQSRSALAEYETPGGGRRGFCFRCGSSLWFRSARGEFSVEAGSVVGPTGGRLAEHIFVADKGDYYVIDDGLPQSDGA